MNTKSETIRNTSPVTKKNEVETILLKEAIKRGGCEYTHRYYLPGELWMLEKLENDLSRGGFIFWRVLIDESKPGEVQVWRPKKDMAMGDPNEGKKPFPKQNHTHSGVRQANPDWTKKSALGKIDWSKKTP